MRLFTTLFLLVSAIALFGGCSEKQFNDTTNDLTKQISDIGEEATEQH